MSQAPAHPSDPLRTSLALTALFTALAAMRLTIPSEPYFDEIHYLPAARELLALGEYTNREHPLLGKELIALGIALFGDSPLGWRIMPLVAGAVTLFASMRAMWFASCSRIATIAFGILLASGFALFVHSRIAMLEIFMVCFVALAAWQFAAAIREPETGHRRLALAGVALGASMAAKWNAVPVAVLPGIAFFAARLSAGRRRLFTSRRGIPVRGVSLIEAFALLGLVPLTVYALTFLPALWFNSLALEIGGLGDLHREMVGLQANVVKPHPYQSNWPEWLINLRAIWYLYEPVDGAQRGVMLIGNPLTMLAGIPALMWCFWTGIARRDWAKLAVVTGYSASLGMWLIADKPVQFYYHYFLPNCFLLAALALVLDDIWQTGRRWIVLGVIAGSVGLFAYFYPITSAAPLDGPAGFERWMWLDTWR